MARGALPAPLQRLPGLSKPAPGVAGREEDECGPHYQSRAIGKNKHGKAGQSVCQVPVTLHRGIAQPAESGRCGYINVRLVLFVDAYIKGCEVNLIAEILALGFHTFYVAADAIDLLFDGQ